MELLIDDRDTFFEVCQSLVCADLRDLTLSERIGMLKIMRAAMIYLTRLGRQLLEGTDNEIFYDFHVARQISCKDFGFIGRSSLDYLDEIIDDLVDELNVSEDLKESKGD
ncbi:MAG: hypothetical protein WB392_12180 [Methanotrichaceae archaeon]